MKKAQREELLQLGQSYIQKFTNSGAQFTRSTLFVKDMISRLENGKSLSPGQLKWYTSVIKEEPKIYNEDLVKELRSYKDVPGIPNYQKSALTDFANLLSVGKSLTERQQTLCDRIVKDAKNIIQNGPWVPTDSYRKQILMGYQFSLTYTANYLAYKPKLGNAISNVKKWKEGTLAFLCKEDADIVANIKKTEQDLVLNFESRHSPGDLMSFKTITEKSDYFMTCDDGRIVYLKNEDVGFIGQTCILVRNFVELIRGESFVPVFFKGSILNVCIKNLTKISSI